MDRLLFAFRISMRLLPELLTHFPITKLLCAELAEVLQPKGFFLTGSAASPQKLYCDDYNAHVYLPTATERVSDSKIGRLLENVKVSRTAGP